jgi:hypothetical protein
MPRESTPLKREKKGDVIINIWEIFRNPDIQDQAIKGVKNLKKRRNEK